VEPPVIDLQMSSATLPGAPRALRSRWTVEVSPYLHFVNGCDGYRVYVIDTRDGRSREATDFLWAMRHPIRARILRMLLRWAAPKH
jgi:hypothetical protein